MSATTTRGLVRTRLAAATAVLSLATAACGTTLPVSELEVGEAGAPVALDPDAQLGAPSTGTGSDPSSLPTAGPGSATTGTGDGVGPAGPSGPAPGATTGGTTGGTTDTSAGDGTATGAPPPSETGGDGGTSPAATGPGVTDDEIAIGISLFEVGNFGSSLGLDVSYGDTEAQAQAVVDWVNANGGIAGRTVKPIYYTVDFSRAGQVERGQYDQEACAKWTEDNKVFAAINNTMAGETIVACLADRGVFGVHISALDREAAERYHLYFYNNAMPILDRRISFHVTTLGTRGYFEGAAVGVMYYNEPAYERIVNELYVPLLKQFGATKVVLQAAPLTGAQEAQTAAALFQREGVTHVSFFGEGGLYPLFFMRAAENQLYRPNYFLNTDHQPMVIQSGAPPRQLQNATVQGWLPSLDVDNARDPGSISASQDLCLQIQRDAGQDMSERGARYTAELYCDGLFWIKQVTDAAPTLTAEGVAEVAAGLGTGYTSPVTFSTFFSQERHDAPQVFRDMAYECNTAACDSGYFTYVGPLTDMP